MKIIATSCVGVLLGTMAFASPPADVGSSTAQFSELCRQETTIGDHKLTLIQISPPVLPKAPPPPEPPALTLEQAATSERMAKKSYAALNLTATVYIGNPTVTQLRWSDESGLIQYQAWSNVDFRYLTQLSYIETATTVYQFFPFVETYSLADFPAGQKSPIPKKIKLSTLGADYVTELKSKELLAQESTLAGLDCLHAYYQVHYSELKAAYEKTEAENAAREEQLRLNPPKTPDTTLMFWIPASK